MKTFILAVDGLEYDLVKKWRLKGLQQKVYGQIDVSNFKHLLTPIIWASFITGELPKRHRVTSWWTFSSNPQVDHMFHWIRYKIPIMRSISQWKLRRLLKLFRLNVRPPGLNDLQRKGLKTIFDYASKPIVIDVPSYNERPSTRERYSKAMDKGIVSYEKEIWRIHYDRVKRIMDKLNIEWDLFMAWIDLADQMGHLYIGKNKLKMLKTYISLDILAHQIRQNLTSNTLFLIVSDHGMELSREGYPEHSNRAFYSFNIDLEWRPLSITDYADFIKSLLARFP
jgi:predicted AlkP superfamily pyrophosphatase or phosphodiesterase